MTHPDDTWTDALFLVACFILSALSALNLAAFTKHGHSANAGAAVFCGLSAIITAAFGVTP